MYFVWNFMFLINASSNGQCLVYGCVCVCLWNPNPLLGCWENYGSVFVAFFNFYSYKNGKLNLNKAGSQATNLFDNKKLTSLAKANRLLASSTRKVTCCRVRTWVWICLHQNQLDAIGSNLSYKVLKKKRVSWMAVLCLAKFNFYGGYSILSEVH